MHKTDSPDFRDLHSKISSDKPYLLIFTGDLNAHSLHNGGPMVIAIMKVLS